MNGVRVNGQRVVEMELKSGDEIAVADLEAAIRKAQVDRSGTVTMTASLPVAKAIWYALKALHPRAPVLSLMPGTIAGQVWISMVARDMERQLGLLERAVDALAPLVMAIRSGSAPGK